MQITETFQVEGIESRIFMMTDGENNWCIGPNRFSTHIVIRNVSADVAFDFFNNFATMADPGQEEMRKAWACYKKACNQTTDSKVHAWHQYMAGKKRVSHGGKFFEWK